MNLFTLDTIIDDILLIIRNNNISASEDLSRAQIEQWIHQYRAQLIKQDIDKRRAINPSYTQTLDPLMLEKIQINDIDKAEELSKPCDYKYKTVQSIPKPLDFHFSNGIIKVSDLHDCPIQKMSTSRRHFQWLRKYTSNEYTYYYKPDYIYVQGVDALRYIKVVGVFEDPTQAGLTSDQSYPMPIDRLGALKQMIFDNELRFMLQRPSDDKNNSTLEEVKVGSNVQS